jgi:hypothetical protein
MMPTVVNRKRVAQLQGFFFAASFVGLFVSQVCGAETYDGKWWLSLNERQRLSFIDGHQSCYYYMVNPKGPFEENIGLYRDRINAYLEKHPDATNEMVDDLLWRVANPPYSQPPPKSAPGGEEWTEKWGYYNGDDYWQLGTDEDHLAFIQGFLECYDRHTNHPNGTFSKPREWYVKAISDWYGFGPDVPIVKGHENDGIPDVLFRFRDEKTH